MAKKSTARKSATRKTAAKKTGARGSARKTAKRSSQKRELINTGSDARYVKRTGSGRFKDSDDVGRAQKTDRGRSAKKTVKSGFGDQGDRREKR